MSQTKYEGFSIGLALVDAIPVLLFGASCIMIGIAYGDPIFIIGAALCFLGGFLKVLWKIIVAAADKDIVWMNKQFRYLMIGGFLLIVVSVVLGVIKGSINFAALGQKLIGLPQLIFFIGAFLGLTAMGVLGSKLDPTKAKSNWIEQLTNSFAQLCLFLGVLFTIIK